MSSVTLSVKSRDASGITFADPTKPSNTVRFRFSTTTKVLNGVSTPNYATEIVVNDSNSVTVGGVSALDALSIRVRISGALESKVRLQNLLNSIAAQFATWENENILQGFCPSTAPVITTP